MATIVSLQYAKADVHRLSTGLQHHLAASGMSLPEDDCVLDYLVTAVRFGRTEARVVVDNGEALGVVAWRTEDDAGFITILYALEDALEGVAESLLAAALENLRDCSVPEGIYAELPQVTPPVYRALDRAGFVGVERFVLCADISQRRWTPCLPLSYELVGWCDDWLTHAASVIYRANAGTLDALIVPEFHSLAASERIIRQTVHEGRYGTFDRQASAFIVDDRSAVVGVTLVTRRRNGQGFTAEICVLPEHRRRGLARALMCHTHRELLSRHITEGILGVTDGNPARSLYDDLGYRQVGSVWTFVWPRPPAWPEDLAKIAR